MADALELIADKIEPSITYTVGDDLLERIAGPLSHGGAPYGGEDDDDDEPTPPGNVRAIRKGAS
jgi:hypothetical protein